jgi:hypothetical protein
VWRGSLVASAHRLPSLTLEQPDVVPHPDKAGGKIGDYWTPLKKKYRAVHERFCCIV